MNNLEFFGRFLIGAALFLFLLGGFFLLVSRLGWPRLPGDFLYKKDNVTIFVPLATGLIISLLLTVILNLIFYFFRR
jgi:hypothetical protein